MNIYSECIKCSEELAVKTLYETRGEHALRKGEVIEIQCVTCRTLNNIHIDEFKAKESKTVKVLALSAFIGTFVFAVVAFLWLIYEKDVVMIWYGVFGVPFLIYGSILVYDRKRVSLFNRLYSKR